MSKTTGSYISEEEINYKEIRGSILYSLLVDTEACITFDLDAEDLSEHTDLVCRVLLDLLIDRTIKRVNLVPFSIIDQSLYTTLTKHPLYIPFDTKGLIGFIRGEQFKEAFELGCCWGKYYK